MLKNLDNLDDFAERDVMDIEMDEFVSNLKRLFSEMDKEIQILRDRVDELEAK